MILIDETKLSDWIDNSYYIELILKHAEPRSKNVLVEQRLQALETRIDSQSSTITSILELICDYRDICTELARQINLLKGVTYGDKIITSCKAGS